MYYILILKYKKKEVEPKETKFIHGPVFPMVLQPIEYQLLPTDCWPHFYLSANRGGSLSSQFRDVETPSRQDLLGINQLQKSIAPQIGTDPIHWLETPLPSGSNQSRIPQCEFKATCFKQRDLSWNRRNNENYKKCKYLYLRRLLTNPPACFQSRANTTAVQNSYLDYLGLVAVMVRMGTSQFLCFLPGSSLFPKSFPVTLFKLRSSPYNMSLFNLQCYLSFMAFIVSKNRPVNNQRCLNNILGQKIAQESQTLFLSKIIEVPESIFHTIQSLAIGKDHSKKKVYSRSPS